MSNNNNNNEQRPNPPPSIPPQPHMLISPSGEYTPYYVPAGEAHRFPGHTTHHLINSLHHPAQEFPQPRNQFPGSDPIMDAREGDGSKPGELSYEKVVAMKDVKDLSADDRHARDAKEFDASPPDGLSSDQKQRWMELYTELFNVKEVPENGPPDQDPYRVRARAELRKLKELADLGGKKQE